MINITATAKVGRLCRIYSCQKQATHQVLGDMKYLIGYCEKHANEWGSYLNRLVEPITLEAITKQNY